MKSIPLTSTLVFVCTAGNLATEISHLIFTRFASGGREIFQNTFEMYYTCSKFCDKGKSEHEVHLSILLLFGRKKSSSTLFLLSPLFLQFQLRSLKEVKVLPLKTSLALLETKQGRH